MMTNGLTARLNVSTYLFLSFVLTCLPAAPMATKNFQSAFGNHFTKIIQKQQTSNQKDSLFNRE